MSIISQSAPAQPGAPVSGGRGGLQLLIDDDAAQRMLISTVARQSGHAVTLAQSCVEAIQQIRTARFDCVTLDLMLGDGDGTAGVLQVLAEAKFAGSVIVISGMNAARRIAARAYARSLGMELQSFPKPVDLAALRICFANLCKTTKGLPVMHMWGGVKVDDVSEQHRS